MVEGVSWECNWGRVVDIDECVKNDSYTTVVCVMLDNCLAGDDGMWAKRWFKFVIVVEEL